jgi:2-iminoacetate synthase ThiH
MNLEDPRLQRILDKVLGGQLLDREDARSLYRTYDLLGLGQLANFVCEQRHGKRAWCEQDAAPSATSNESTEVRIERLLLLRESKIAVYEPELRAELTGYTYLKDIAVARLLLGQAEHIRARLCRQVENVCQMALRFGADTLVGEDLRELQRQARAAGRDILT